MRLPSPTAVLRTVLRPVGRVATVVARRVLGVQPDAGELLPVPDDMPRDQMFSQPLVCETSARDTEDVEGGTRVAFRVVVRDALGRRCPDLSVTATIVGPERTGTGQVTTDMFGAAVFRMTGPAGHYGCDVVDVAAGALEWDRDGSTTTASTTAD